MACVSICVVFVRRELETDLIAAIGRRARDIRAVDNVARLGVELVFVVGHKHQVHGAVVARVLELGRCTIGCTLAYAEVQFLRRASVSLNTSISGTTLTYPACTVCEDKRRRHLPRHRPVDDIANVGVLLAKPRR